MGLIYKEYILKNDIIEEISSSVYNALEKYDVEYQMRLKVRFEIEEILLNIISFYKEDKDIKVAVGKQFGRIVVRLIYQGKSFNPIEDSNNPISDQITRQLGLSPSWNHRGNENTVFIIAKDRKPIKRIYFTLIALILGVVFGLLGRLLPDATKEVISTYILTPTANLFLGLLTTFAGLMILLTIINSIQGMGDIKRLGKMGNSVIFWMFGICLLFSITAILICFPFIQYNYAPINEDIASEFGQVTNLLFDMFPKNIIDPFKTGNIIQIIVIALIIGIVLLLLGEPGGSIRNTVSDLTILFQKVVSAVCYLIPLFVFASIGKQMLIGNWEELILLIKPLIMCFAIPATLTILMIIFVSIRLRCPLNITIKKFFKPSLKAFTTASSISALLPCMEASKNDIGVEEHTASFLYPIGSVLFMPASTTFITVITLCLAEIYQVQINPVWFILAALIVTIATASLPPIPGAGMMMFSVIFSSLGIPLEGLTYAIIIDLIVDFFDTGYNSVLLTSQITVIADSFKLLNRDVLLNKNKSE